MKTRFFVAVLVAVVSFGFAYAQDADALTVNATWTHSAGTCFDATFSVFVPNTPNAVGVFTLDGKIFPSTWGAYPIQGTAVLDSGSNTFRVSLFFTSATGETFTFGFAVNATSMAGTGTYQRIAHGGVADDCPGSISGVSILP